MAISKVILDGSTLLDVTNSTVNAQRILSGYVAKGADGVDVTGDYAPPTFDTQAKSVTPTTTQQTVTPDSGYDGLSSVTVGAMPTGTAGTPTATKGSVSNHSVSVTPSVTNAAGYIEGGTKTGTAVTVSASELVSGTKSISASGNTDVTEYATASVPEAEASVSINSADMEFYTTSGTRMWRVRPRFLVDGAGWVSQDAAGSWKSFNAVPSNTTVTPSTSAQTIGGADYMMEGAATVAAMPTGTAGTPTATKGSVSNHSLSVTPSVTNTTGYITGGTKTGTAVSVSASELVSGTLSVTQNGTVDVTNYASASVNVAASSNDFIVTLTYNSTTEMWEPDCTYAEVYAAYGAGKNVKAVSNAGSTAAFIIYDSDEGCFFYSVYEPFSEASGTPYFNWGADVLGYMWDSSGIYDDGSSRYYDTSPATAVPSDVAQGKYYYNASGIHVGTASGGGGEDVNYARTVSRSGAITSVPNVTSIGDYAYYKCVGLNVASLPSELTSIGQYAFQDCTSLALTSLPSGCTDVGYYAFYGCSNLALTSLPSGMTTIKSHAFDGCARLALTSLPSGVTSIQQYAFRSSGIALTSLPSGCTTIDTYAFQVCRNLALTSLPNGIESISSNAFQACTSLALTSLPSSVTYIGSSAFNGCTSISTISCEGALTTVGSGSFSGNSTYPSGLTSASFPNAIVSSWSSAFGNSTSTSACRLLETVDIGKSSAIAAGAFQNCIKLQTLVLRKTGSICTLSNISAFTNTPMRGYNGLSGTVYVPSDLISAYQTATNWSTIYGGGYLTFAAIEGSEWEL